MKITLEIPPSTNRYLAKEGNLSYNYTSSNQINSRSDAGNVLRLWPKPDKEVWTMFYFTPVVARCQVGDPSVVIPKASGVYLLRNRISGGFYVGSTRNLRNRYQQHAYGMRGQYHHNPKLREAWLLYGPSAFEFVVIELVPKQSDLIDREQYWMDRLNAVGDGYNYCPLAGRHLGAKRGEETRRKLSEANTGKKHSEESKQKMRAAKLGRKLTEEHKRKVGDASRGKPGPTHSEEQLWKFRKLTPEQITEFRGLLADGWSPHRLGTYFGIARSTAYRIANGESYKVAL